MSYFRRPNPKSTWKRPKPKIYDCNARDLENFYQSSYSDYLNAKADVRARELDRERRGDAEALTRRFEQRRASSLVYGEDDGPRNYRFIQNRETSNDRSGINEHSFLRTSLANSSEQEGRSSISSTRNVSFNTSLNAPDANSEMASIESRLERLRKLREELGLPSEINTGNDSSSISSNRIATESSSTSSYSQRQSPPIESRGRETSRFLQSSSVRSDSRSRGSPPPSRSGVESSNSYSSRRSEKASARNGHDDMFSNYSTKSKTTRGGDSDGISSSTYESSTRTRNRKRVEKPSLDGIDLEFDDDALLTDMRKKIPSSSEILEKIRNMDIE